LNLCHNHTINFGLLDLCNMKGFCFWVASSPLYSFDWVFKLIFSFESSISALGLLLFGNYPRIIVNSGLSKSTCGQVFKSNYTLIKTQFEFKFLYLALSFWFFVLKLLESLSILIFSLFINFEGNQNKFARAELPCLGTVTLLWVFLIWFSLDFSVSKLSSFCYDRSIIFLGTCLENPIDNSLRCSWLDSILELLVSWVFEWILENKP
jgi:hypothetical protein